MDTMAERYNYFDQYYKHSFFIIQNEEKIIREDPIEKKCRFCGKSYPEVEFKKKAHAVPELIGNKTIFSKNECDICNAHFSSYLEDHLSKYIGLGRTFMQTHGKEGVPSFKTNDKKTRVDFDKDGLNIKETIGSSITKFSDDKKEFLIEGVRQPYVPIAVFKTFVKMAISLMPYGILTHFNETIQWLLEKSHIISKYQMPATVCYEAFIPGPNPFNQLTLIGLQRKSDNLHVPFFQFIVCFNNMMYQLAIPCREKDYFLNGTIETCVYPNPYDTIENPFGKMSSRILDLSSTSLMRNEKISMSMGYVEKELILDNRLTVVNDIHE